MIIPTDYSDIINCEISTYNIIIQKYMIINSDYSSLPEFLSLYSTITTIYL